MTPKSFFIGVVLFFVVTVSGIGFNYIGGFIDFPFLIAVTGTLIAYYIAGPGIARTKESFACLFKGNGANSDIAEFFHNSSIVSLLAGMFFMMVQNILLFAGGADDMGHILCIFGLSLIACLYGFGFAILFVFCKCRVLSMQSENTSQDTDRD